MSERGYRAVRETEGVNGVEVNARSDARLNQSLSSNGDAGCPLLRGSEVNSRVKPGTGDRGAGAGTGRGFGHDTPRTRSDLVTRVPQTGEKGE